MKDELIAGTISLIFGVLFTYMVYLLGIPFSNVTQALISVGIASFFSGFFSRYFCKR